MFHLILLWFREKGTALLRSFIFLLLLVNPVQAQAEKTARDRPDYDLTKPFYSAMDAEDWATVNSFISPMVKGEGFFWAPTMNQIKGHGPLLHICDFPLTVILEPDIHISGTMLIMARKGHLGDMVQSRRDIWIWNEERLQVIPMEVIGDIDISFTFRGKTSIPQGYRFQNLEALVDASKHSKDSMDRLIEKAEGKMRKVKTGEKQPKNRH